MIRSIFLRGLLFVVLWWILAEGRHDGWLLGGVAVAAATWTSIKLQPPGTQPMRLAGLVGFLRFFLWHSLRGGMQVAAMALRGRAALRPGIIELRVTLPPGGARILLVNAVPPALLDKLASWKSPAVDKAAWATKLMKGD